MASGAGQAVLKAAERAIGAAFGDGGGGETALVEREGEAGFGCIDTSAS